MTPIPLLPAAGRDESLDHLAEHLAPSPQATPNISLERTQPQRGFMCDVEMLRRSARSRYHASVFKNMKIINLFKLES